MTGDVDEKSQRRDFGDRRLLQRWDSSGRRGAVSAARQSDVGRRRGLVMYHSNRRRPWPPEGSSYNFYGVDNDEAKAKARAELAKVAEARQVLERRERRALLACWRTHVPIDDVAKILGVSRATAHRRTAAAVDAQPAK